jgi:hypothetical protein
MNMIDWINHVDQGADRTRYRREVYGNTKTLKPLRIVADGLAKSHPVTHDCMIVYMNCTYAFVMDAFSFMNQVLNPTLVSLMSVTGFLVETCAFELREYKIVVSYSRSARTLIQLSPRVA